MVINDMRDHRMSPSFASALAMSATKCNKLLTTLGAKAAFWASKLVIIKAAACILSKKSHSLRMFNIYLAGKGKSKKGYSATLPSGSVLLHHVAAQNSHMEEFS